jgi:ribonuclease PH
MRFCIMSESRASSATSATSATAARTDGRAANQLRPIRFLNGIAPHASGSTLIEWGRTRVICGVTVEETVPRWMKEQSVTGGWITAEYSMLPYSTLQRKQRDINKGKIDGRAMRSALDLEKLGPRTIWVDCDVLQADGGTRTAAITGSFVALSLAVKKLQKAGKITADPIANAVAAVSVGIVGGVPLLDLNYVDDVGASVDMNIVMTARGEFVELQGTGEESTFSETQLADLLALGRSGIKELLALQEEAAARAE